MFYCLRLYIQTAYHNSMKLRHKLFLILIVLLVCVCFSGSVSAGELHTKELSPSFANITKSIIDTELDGMQKDELSGLLSSVSKTQLSDLINSKPKMKDKVLLIVSSPELKSNTKLEMQTEVFGMNTQLSSYLKSKSMDGIDSEPTADDVQKETEWNAYLLNYVTYYKGTGEFGGPIV